MSTAPTTTKYLDQAADPVGNSFYKVMAVNGVGESTYCHELSINAVQPGETACQSPYITVDGPGGPGNLTDETMGELTIQRVGIGEPFVSCTDKSITFQMKVTTMDPAGTGQATPPPNGEWQVLFNVPGSLTSDGQPHAIFVEANTQNEPAPTAATVNYDYGYRSTSPTGGSLDSAQCGVPIPLISSCPVTGSMAADGTITMKLDVSSTIQFFDLQGTHVFDLLPIPPGTQFTMIQGNTYLLAGGSPAGVGGGFIESVSTTDATGSYTTSGNLGCSAGEPVAGLTATPMSGTSPLNVNFDASSSNDTSPCATIDSYTLDFGDGTPAVNQASPLFSHTYNSDGDFPARLTVTDSAGHVSNPAQIVISVHANVPQLTGVVSRKTHGSAGVKDLTLSLGSTPTVECRAPGATGVSGVDYQVIFVFPNTLTSVASVGASATGATQPGPSSGSIGTDPHQYIVNLTGVPDAQYITVTLNNVQDSTGASGSVSATMGVLVGDVNANKVVSNTDVASVKAQVSAPVTDSNFRNDVNANGVISNTDVAVTKGEVSKTLPP